MSGSRGECSVRLYYIHTYMAVWKKPYQGKWLKMEISPCRRKDVMLMFVDIAREVFKFWVSAERARHGHGTGTSRVRRRFFCKLMELRLRHGHGTGTGSSIVKLDIQRCLVSHLIELGGSLQPCRGTGYKRLWHGYGLGFGPKYCSCCPAVASEQA